MNFLNSDDPWMALIYSAIAGYVFYLWWCDLRENREGHGGLPGASSASLRLLIIAGMGGIIITLLESWGEILGGIASEQSELAYYAILPLMAAAIIEEIVFRGYLVVDGKGKAWLWGSVLLFSLLFALIHPYLWDWDDGLQLQLTGKGIFSTAFVFLNSLWFYAVRFSFGNRTRSLLPCFVAHAASNGTVFLVKLWQGFVVW